MLISIIIPCYNSERFIAKTLDMLISQNLLDCEVIVVNDGSTDKTLDIVSKYVSNNKEIRCINKKNEGVSVARNIGIKTSKGKYIYFLDSDDTLSEGTLDFFRNTILNNSGYNFYGFGYKSTTINNEVLYAYYNFNEKVFDGLELRKKFLTKKICFHICSCIYEKQFLVNNNLYFSEGLAIGEDIEFLLKVFLCAQSLKYFSRVCFIYQIRDDSAMQGYKVFSTKHWHSYEIRRDICLSSDYQNKSIQKYSNFFLKNEYLSHLFRFLKSNCDDSIILNNFINDNYILSLPSVSGAIKNTLIIKIARLLPLKTILKTIKRR